MAPRRCFVPGINLVGFPYYSFFGNGGVIQGRVCVNRPVFILTLGRLSYSSEEDKKKENNQNDAQQTAGVVSPAAAIRPAGECTNEQDDQKN